MSMVLKVCTIWRCSSHSLAGFLLLVYVPFNLGWLVLDFKLTVGFASSVHCHIFGFDSSLLRLCLFYCFGSAPTLLVQVYWASSIALWFPTLSVNSYTTYRKTDGSVQWYANRLVLGVMVCKPFGSRRNGTQTVWFSARWCVNHRVLAWFVRFDLTCLVWLVFAYLVYCACFV